MHVALCHSENGLLANNIAACYSKQWLFVWKLLLYYYHGREQAGTGQWIASNREDYTQPGTHPFEVRRLIQGPHC